MWFPKLQLKILYSETPITSAKYIGVFCNDGNFYIVPLTKLSLPSIRHMNFELYSTTNIPKTFSEIETDDTSLYMFTFKLFKYVYQPVTGDFKSVLFNINTKNTNIITYLSQGLTIPEYKYQKQIYGECDLNIEIASYLKLLFTEFSDPFYLFQVFSFALWISNNYKAYAYVIIVTTIISLFISVTETRSNLLNIQQMARYSCDVVVHRRNNENEIIKETISSIELCPGDVFEIPEDGMVMPCDSIVLNGNVIINEAMLTGESTPIFKVQLPPLNAEFNKEKCTKHILYAGTKIIQKRNNKNNSNTQSIYSDINSRNTNKTITPNTTNNINSKSKTVTAIVLSTGFNTTKGNLIRSILFPKAVDFKFKKDSIRYIFLMAILSIIGFVISLPFLIKSGMNWISIIYRSLDLITTTVPPALPACLGIGISYALTLLKSHKIACINRDRVNIAGKINMICFDKTGTLTEDHLDIGGFLPITFNKNQVVFDNYFVNCNINAERAYEHYKKKLTKNQHDKSKDLNLLYIECLACCHSITRVNHKLIGDPIDVKMFESCGWILTENDNDDLISTYVRPKQEKDLQTKLEELDEDDDDEELIISSHYEIGLVKCFDFSSQLQRMSVVCKNSNEKYFKVFVKGSPEKIKELCKQESIPKNFDDILNDYTLKGYRVLALACKMLKMDFLQCQKLSRDKAETNLIFLGLLIVRNKLKSQTIPSINELSKAKLRMVMATGDNILTAIAVSKECKLINPDSTVYTCNIDKENKELKWNLVENYTDVEQFKLIDHIDEMQKKFKENENEINNDNTNNEYKDLVLNYNLHNNTSEDDYGSNSRKHSGNMDHLNTFTKHFQPETFGDDFIDEHDEDDEEQGLNDNERKLINNKSNKNKNENEENDEEFLFNIDLEKLPKTSCDLLSDEFVIAISGITFEKLWKLRNMYITTHDIKYLQYYDTFRLILKNCFIFARMSPDHKTLLVQCLREEKFTVCMCGDGANDCGALKSADVGVSLSTEEASIAAHFSSEVFDISCLIHLLLQGKASLVTSIQTFKYMMLYSLIQFICVTILMVLGSYLSDFQFLTSDLVIIFPLAFLISRTEAETQLTHHRPTGALISVPIITSIVIQTLLMLLFQLLGWIFLINQTWYYNFCKCRGEKVLECYDNSTIFLVSNMQYLVSAISFSISYPFKKSILTNHLLCICLIIAFVYSAYLIINPDSFSMALLDLAEIPSYEFRYLLLGLTVINCIVCYLVERFFVPLIGRVWKKKKYENLKKGIIGKNLNYNLNQLNKIRKLSC